MGRRIASVFFLLASMNQPDDSAVNPYAAPTAEISSLATAYTGDQPAMEQAEEVRRAHISHEASVRSIGLLYLLGGFFGVLGSIVSVTSLVGQAQAFGIGSLEFVVVIIGLVITVGSTLLQFILGFGLRKLKPWARIGAMILTVLALLYIGFILAASVLAGGMPFVGVLILMLFAAIPVYILWLLASSKGRLVFSPEYQVIREMTPNIKYKTSIIVKIAFGFLLVILVLGVGIAVVGGIAAR